ncbi:uncharacterized protein LOC132707360 isoform X2 [Cylas formicarius]|uniref:uncharacterized protein LOC132707360 isoform X2 n=1 Tax=Cylas formicarius TaxID=197179 RepID=UPI00295838F7|nr:uncharacterized protein LOC132707360 isoform X2 [Cylas formicarius]
MDIILLLFFCGLCRFALTTTVNSCSGSKGLQPNATISIGYLENECLSTPCEVILGCSIIMTTKFNSPRYLEDLTPRIHASALGAELDYPLFQNNACDGIINTQCPIVKGEKVTYQYTMNLFNVFPENHYDW